MNNCVYCGKETQCDVQVEFVYKRKPQNYSCCSVECAQKADLFFINVNRFSTVSTIVIFLFLGLMFADIFRVVDGIYSEIAMSLFGIMAALFPFTMGPGYGIEWWGIRASSRIPRVIGLVIAALGIMQIIWA